VNVLDFLLVLIVAWSVIAGFLAGLTRVGIGFAATLAGILFGFWFYYIPAGWIHNFITSTTASNLIGFFAVFVFFVMAGAIVGKILSRALKLVGLSFFDRLGGAAFGFVRGTILVVAVVTVITAFSPTTPPKLLVNSKVMPYAAEAANVMAMVAPRSLKDAYHDSLKKLKRIWSEHSMKSIKGETV